MEKSAHAKWIDTRAPLDAAKRLVAELTIKLMEAEIDLDACTFAELMAFSYVPEDERGDLCLPDDILCKIAEMYVVQSRKNGLPFDLSKIARVNRAWARSVPKFRVDVYEGKAIEMCGSTLLFIDRAVDVNTRAILATFEGQPALLPDGATLMLRNSDGITWRSLRDPPHHAPITLSKKRLLEIYPNYDINTKLVTSRIPGIAYTQANGV